MLRPNDTELAVALALVRAWPGVKEPAAELANILALERERHLREFEQLVQPIGGGDVPRRVVSAQAVRDAIEKVRQGA